MRDPKRFEKVLNAVGKVWKANPDWRLGQLIVNLTQSAGYSDPFFMEDDRLLEEIEKWRSHADQTEYPLPASGMPGTGTGWDKIL